MAFVTCSNNTRGSIYQSLSLVEPFDFAAIEVIHARNDFESLFLHGFFQNLAADGCHFGLTENIISDGGGQGGFGLYQATACLYIRRL